MGNISEVVGITAAFVVAFLQILLIIAILIVMCLRIWKTHCMPRHDEGHNVEIELNGLSEYGSGGTDRPSVGQEVNNNVTQP